MNVAISPGRGSKNVGTLTNSLDRIVGCAIKADVRFMANSGGHKRREEGPARFEAQHAAIIGRTLRWADEAAARGDYAEAVRWVDTVRGLGQDLPDEYEAKQQTWLNALELDRRSGCG